ncbi:RluA family pseudouridine synthase [Solobacterium moorei]|uniref:Pseudouridine synthase n=2 Tax=Solobacterium moorei TaxID=102148 RepID=E7MQ02_9FIRM|nr:RluA family pseudouridine synthase [Solobacterium moorei]EFW23921.1 pseudouridine synthase, RluA family [Solobacterium moorei F0204]RGT56156.1 RluA family pseudouridine synthase [Solobacterium moorei]
MAKQTWIVSEDTKERLDKYLSSNTELSRTRVQQLADDGMIFVNGKVAKSSSKVVTGDEISCDVPEDRPVDILPENIPLDILYEDHDIIVINKPKGMVVHPAPGNYSNTMVNALLYHCKDLSGINGVIRPGIVHRIDKDTTGCIVACKNDKAHEAIAKQLENKTCHRVYKTIVVGNITHDDGLIDAPIGRDPRDRQRMKVTEENSRDARTHFHVLERFNVATYLECRLETGRTHQIRAHMKYINHPVMGDDKYGKPCPYMDTQGQVLHASELTLVHPTTGETMTFHAPLPSYFEKLLEILRKRVV